jgi:hypothetical protein
MGSTYEAKCLQCGEKFYVNKGGGFNFYLLHCDACGAEKTVTATSETVWEPSVATSETAPKPLIGSRDTVSTRSFWARFRRKQTFRGKTTPTSSGKKTGHITSGGSKHYGYGFVNKAKVEQIAGTCPRCGGSFKFDAPARCPTCKSAEIECDSKPRLLYD